MARGWESKSVEAQQSQPPTTGRSGKSVEDRERQAKREGLELSRKRIVRELETARSEVHRAALQNALAFLDEELARIT